MSGFIRDDFAGPGGWSEGLRLLGLVDVGVEFDADAAAVAIAASHKRWVTDVTSEACRDYRWPTLWGYIASPPCQTFSMAGKGDGRLHMASLLLAMKYVAEGYTPEDAIMLVSDSALDVRSLLVLEPLLVIREHEPVWVAMEQVPGVLPIWEAYAEILRSWGYSVWTGYLQAEMYGVPQTRKRAVLMAHRERVVTAPQPTHSRYYSRTPDRLDEGVLKWVSMYEAIQMGMATRPAPTVTGGGAATGGAEPFAHLARWAERPDYQQRSNYSAGGAPGATAEERGRTMRTLDEPSVVITSKGFQWLRSNQKPGGVQPGATAIDENGYQIRTLEQPAMTMTGESGSYVWAGNESVRVTVQEAGILQSFPVDYPWAAAGNKGSQYQRVGDAVPPLLARAIIGSLLDIPFDPALAEATSG